MDLSGQVALVTGAAAGGIGEACARKYADLGARVVLTDIHEEYGRQAADALGEGHRFLHHDVADSASWNEVLGVVKAEYGQLNLLHSNAATFVGRAASTATDVLAQKPGWFAQDPLELLTEHAFNKICAVNLAGTFLGITLALPLLETCSGSILVTSSLAGISPVSADPLYSMTKHAQVGLILSLTKALSGRGVRINALCPGPTLTRATREIAAAVAAATGQPVPGDEDTSAIDPSQPRMQPEEIAQACVAVLASGQTGGIWVKAWSDRPVYRHEFADIPGWGLEH